MRYSCKLVAQIILALPLTCAAQEWLPLFDGKTLNGWKASENKSSWRVEEGAIVTKGPRSHLFYDGEVNEHDFENFELMADVSAK